MMKLLACTGGMIVCFQVLCVLLAEVEPTCELASHFCMHSLCGGVLVLPALLVFRQSKVAGAVGIAVMYLLWVTEPWQLVSTGLTSPQSKSSEPQGLAEQSAIRVMSWNVLTYNRSFNAIRQQIKEVDPDVLVLIEVAPGLLEQLPELKNEYSTFVERSRWHGRGIAVFSRVADTRLEFRDFGYSHQPGVVMRFAGTDSLSRPGFSDARRWTGGQHETTLASATNQTRGQSELQLVALHALSPIPMHRQAIRDRQLRAVRDWAFNQPGPICLCGDLNTTPWTRSFRELCDIGFVDSRHGHGNGASWPARLGRWGIPIDHALSRGDCVVTDRRVIRQSGGSDHFPIVFTVSWKSVCWKSVSSD